MTTTAEDFDWSDLDQNVELRDTNTMPRTGTTRSAPSGARRSSARRGTKRLEELQKSLSNQMFQAGGMIALGMPVTGTYVCQQSEVFPDAIIELARKRSDWVDALEKIADVGPGITVGRTVLGIAAAMGTDRYHRTNGESGFDPDKRACQFLGVTAAYYSVYKEGDNASQATYSPPPHGAFVPVS
jgi:hypothetical protein